MKKYLLLLLILLVLTGCSVYRMDTLNYEQVLDKVLSLKIKTYNKIGKGYKYYAPRGNVRIDSNSYNDVIKNGDMTYYLYVDVVSYYYKDKIDYKENNNIYFSKKLKNKNKEGYIEIREKKDKFFVQMVYNYAKIETYVTKDKLNITIKDISYILSSIKFNDSLLNKMYEAGELNAKEETYKLFDNKEKEGNFIEYIKEYDKYEDNNTETVEEEIKVETTKEADEKEEN